MWIEIASDASFLVCISEKRSRYFRWLEKIKGDCSGRPGSAGIPAGELLLVSATPARMPALPDNAFTAT